MVLGTPLSLKLVACDRDDSVPRDRWSFHVFEMKEAQTQPFADAVPQVFKSTTYFVANRPFLETKHVKRVLCLRGGTTALEFNTDGELALALATEHLSETGGYAAMYFDGQLSAIPKVEKAMHLPALEALIPCTKR